MSQQKLLRTVSIKEKWAKNLSVVLFSITILGALITVGTISTPLMSKVPLLVMILVYSMGVYHFGVSKSYKAFF